MQMVSVHRGAHDANAVIHQMIWTAIFTLVCLVAARYAIVIQSRPEAVLSDRLRLSIVYAIPDMIFLASATLLSIVVLSAVKWQGFRSCLVWFLRAAFAFIILAGFGNVISMRFLSEPFTYQWLLYSDFLNGNDVRAAARDMMDWRVTLSVMLIVMFALYGGATIGNIASRFRQRSVVAAITAWVIVTIGGGAAFIAANSTETMASAQTRNPIVAFARSFLQAPVPSLLAVDGERYAADFENEGHRRLKQNVPVRGRDHRIDNVLVFVLESTPAKALQMFGADQDVTPNLTSYRSQAKLFNNIYAHTPATNYSLFALLTSVYPEISYYGMTATHPYAPFESIGNVLKNQGFRTGMFWSNDKRFQRFDEFIQNKGFDVFQDFRERNCDEVFETSTEKTKFMDYGSEECTVDSTLSWIDHDPSRPFFAVIATAATHYPYKIGRQEEELTSEPLKNSYLNALKVTDEAFGKLMNGLRHSGRLENTLVVVLGDHGEAFGEHGQWGHATAIYDENVHIPLMMINSHLFSGDMTDTLGGVVDISPTILNLLGIETPDEWQGRSLFASARPDRVYYFSPWNGFLLGYRENTRSVVFNATSGSLEVYDLAADPHQTSNIKDSVGRTPAELIAPLAYMVQSQNKLISSLVAGDETPRDECVLTSIEFSAGATEFQGKPIVSVFVDGDNLASQEIAGIQSTHSDSNGIKDEVLEAAKHVQTYHLDVHNRRMPREVRLKFTNDLWQAGKQNGDRNVILADLTINGHNVPEQQVSVAPDQKVVLASKRAVMYENSEIVYTGPFVAGCSLSAVAAAH